MNYFQELNKKLDEGWKLTDSNCPICKSSIIYNPKDKSLFCIKCVKPCKMDTEIIDDQEDEREAARQKKQQSASAAAPLQKPLQPKEQKKEEKKEDDDDEDNEFDSDYESEFKWHLQKKDNSRTDEISKLLSQKLLQGYAMLQECCAQCYAPIMRSKQGQYTCVGCNWTKTKKQFDEMLQVGENQGEQTTQSTTTQNQPTQQQPIAQAKAPQQQISPAQQSQQPPLQTQQNKSKVDNQTSSSQPKQQQKAISSATEQKYQVSRSNEEEEFYEITQKTLNIAAAFYQQQIQVLAAQNQTGAIDNIIKTSLKELINRQKELTK